MDVTVHVDIHNLVHNVHNIQKYIQFSLVSSLFSCNVVLGFESVGEISEQNYHNAINSIVGV